MERPWWNLANLGFCRLLVVRVVLAVPCRSWYVTSLHSQDLAVVHRALALGIHPSTQLGLFHHWMCSCCIVVADPPELCPCRWPTHLKSLSDDYNFTLYSLLRCVRSLITIARCLMILKDFPFGTAWCFVLSHYLIKALNHLVLHRLGEQHARGEHVTFLEESEGGGTLEQATRLSDASGVGISNAELYGWLAWSCRHLSTGNVQGVKQLVVER